MKFHSARLLRAAGAGAAIVLSAACFGGGGDADNADGANVAEEVDQEASATVTEQETSAFRAPADSVLTPQQVEAYIKTSLLQYDLIRQEAPKLAERVQKMEERGKDGGVLSGLRNIAEGGQLMVQSADLIGGSFVRSARTLGYNPAEMEWVRERMGELSGYLIAKPMMEATAGMGQQMRQQAEAFRGQPGFSEEQIQEMLRQADEMDRQARENQGVAQSVMRNYEVVHKFRPNVTDPMWMSIGISSGSSGLLALNWANPQDSSATRKLEEFRQVFTDALANKVSPGMENQPAATN